jgi:hypothetical protein
MRVGYKIFPTTNDPGYGGAKSTWMPMLPVSLLIGHSRSPRFDALVDSGAFTTYFRSDIGRAFGLKIDGEEGELRDVVDGLRARVYYHQVKICIAEHVIAIRAGFYDKLGCLASSGGMVSSNNFTVTFDPCNNPPGLAIERIYRA